MKHENGHIALGVTVFCTVAAILLFYDTLFGGKVVLKVGSQFLTSVQPILYGAFIAYLLAPMVNCFEEVLFTGAMQRAKDNGRSIHAGIRAASMLLTWAVIAFFAYLLASFLLPELYKSILQLVTSADDYYRTISDWVMHLLETNPTVAGWVSQQMSGYFTDINNWLTKGVLPQIQTVMTTVSGGVISLLNFAKNMLVGIIVSVYLLATKEHCSAYGRKLICALFSQENVRWVLRGVRKMDSIFSGFVRGKLLDSIIIGILCFAGCSILGFPYTPLVSVFVGVTNIIPFFGPFLGAIPSTFLILLVSPMKALYFLFFVLALQQLDGNVIGPKILGDKTGLSSLWVIVAILVGGSFFGVPGMFFGVPVCACFYCAANFILDVRLRKKGLPAEIKAYETGQSNGKSDIDKKLENL
ncbi:MAG: AI-2E family transporter [Oscillibacter sp.]|nr:AI-2E family transporter [Oscillibacter sp.]